MGAPLEALPDRDLPQLWQDKVLVCLCGTRYVCGGTPGEWYGPQKQAQRAEREILKRGISLPTGIRVGLLEDQSCGRRSGPAGPCDADVLMKAHLGEVSNGS